MKKIILNDKQKKYLFIALGVVVAAALTVGIVFAVTSHKRNSAGDESETSETDGQSGDSTSDGKGKSDAVTSAAYIPPSTTAPSVYSNSTNVTFNDLNRRSVGSKYSVNIELARKVFNGEIESYSFGYGESDVKEFADFLRDNVYVYVDDISISDANNLTYVQSYARESSFVEAYVKSSVAKCVTRSMTQKQAAQAIHDYIVANFDYDYTYNNHSVYSMITTGKGVCQAYTNLYKAMCRYVGIDCVAVYGTANSSSVPGGVGSHSWNRLCIDGVYYYVDVTWDDCLSNDSYNWLSEKQMSVDHKTEKVITYGIYQSYSVAYTYIVR